MRVAVWIVAASTALASASFARAEDAPAVAPDPASVAPPASAPFVRPDAPSPGRWTLDAGLAVRERPDHVGARSYTTDVWPAVELQWGGRLHVSLDDGIKWSAVKAAPFAFGPVAEYRQAYNDKLPPRTDKLSDSVELGGFAQASLGFGTLEARLRHAVSGYDGNSADLAFDTGAPITKRLTWTVEARASWVDRDYLRRVAAAQHGGPPLPAQARTQDYVTAGVQLGLSYALTSRTTLTVLPSEDRVLSHIPARFLSSRDLLGLSLVVTHRWSGRKPRW